MFAVLVTALGFSRAQESPLRVENLTPAGTSVLPGKSTTAAIRLTNTGGSSMSVTAAAVVPPGWRIVLLESEVALTANSSRVQLVTFYIPPGAPAGTYSVSYTAEERSSGMQRIPISVAVTERRSLDVTILNAPRFAAAGSELRVTFLITNLGNAEARLRFRTRSALQIPFTVSPSSLVLPAGGADTITVSATTDGSISESVQLSLELIAEDEADVSSTARTSSVVEVIPAPREPEQRYHTLPLHAKLRWAGEDRRSGLQGEILGAGSLTEYRTDRLSFLLRAQDLQPYSPLGPRDEYRLSYSRGGLEVDVGDHPYTLTPLTELGRYGFGGRIAYETDPIAAGAFYHRTRWVLPVQQQQAAFFRYSFPAATHLEISYLGKREVTPADVLSLRATSEVLTGTQLDAEVGHDARQSAQNQGLSVRVRGRQQPVAYDLRYVRAGRNFYGYYRDIDHFSTAATVTPWKNIRFEGQFFSEQRNLSRDPSLFSAPRSRLWLIGAGYGSYAAVFYRDSRQNDALPVPTYDRTQQTLQLRFGYPLPSASVFANLDFGRTNDHRGGVTAPFRRYALYGSYRPSSRSSIGTSLEYSSEQGAVLAQVLDRYSVSVNAWALVGRATQISLNLFASRSVSVTRVDYGLADLTVEHVFPFGHTILGRLRHTAYSPSFGVRETAFLLEYGIPIGVPVRRLTSTGELRGTIKDLESGKGVAGALLKAGRFSSLSDASGSFLLSTLPPGTYYAAVDRQSIGLNRVPTQPMPAEVVITGGEAARLDIGILRSASVTGTATLYDFAESAALDTSEPALREKGGMPNVLVELTDGTTTIRRITDNKGRFVVDDVVPGTWTLAFRSAQLPPNSFLESPQTVLTLSPGERREVSTRILPRRRRIRIVEQGRVLDDRAVAERRPDDIRREPRGRTPTTETIPTRALPRIRSAEIVRQRVPLGFALNVATVSSEGQAVREAVRLQQQTGYKTLVQRLPSEGGALYGVRIGVFSSRSEAERVRDEIAARPAPVLYGFISAVHLSAPFEIRSASWTSEEEAVDELTALERLGYQAVIEPSDLPGFGKRWHLRIGPFADVAEAREAQINLASAIRQRRPPSPDLPPR